MSIKRIVFCVSVFVVVVLLASFGLAALYCTYLIAVGTYVFGPQVNIANRWLTVSFLLLMLFGIPAFLVSMRE